MTLSRRFLILAGAVLAAGTSLQAAVVFPVKEYAKPGESIVVKFVNEKGAEGRQALDALGADAGRLDGLYTPAAAADIAGSDGAPLFKVYSAAGKTEKVNNVKPAADGTVDLGAACPAIKDGGTFFVVWKDAPPLVVETLFEPGRGLADLAKVRARIDNFPPDQKKQALAEFSPVVTHMEIASYALITTDKGAIKARFAYDAAPHTVDNFISLSRQNFYDGTAFHRIIKGFMIQGGDALGNDPDLAGTGGPGYRIMDEFSDKKHNRGVLSMANANSPDRHDTSGSQFFIMHANNTNLDGSYNAFGDVFEGMDVVDDIATKAVVENDGSGKVTGPKPQIVSIKILPATAAIYGLK